MFSSLSGLLGGPAYRPSPPPASQTAPAPRPAVSPSPPPAVSAPRDEPNYSSTPAPAFVPPLSQAAPSAPAAGSGESTSSSSAAAPAIVLQERRPPAETQARQQAATPSFTLDDLARALSTNQLDDTQDARAAAFAAHEKSLIDALVDGMKKAPQHAALDVLGGARDDTPALRYAQSAYADTSDGGSDEDAADDPDDTRYAI